MSQIDDKSTPQWLLEEDPLLLNKRLLRVCGLLPADTYMEKQLKTIINIVGVYFTVTMVTGAFIQAYFSHKNFMEIIECGTVCITQIKCLIKIGLVLHYEKEVRFVIDSLINNFIIHRNMLKEKVVSKIKIGKRLAWWITVPYTSLFIITIGLLALDCISANKIHEKGVSLGGNDTDILNTFKRRLPLKIWLPFGNRSPWYEIAFMYQIFGFTFEIYSICIIDTFIVVLIMYTSIQFELLGTAIQFSTENVITLLDINEGNRNNFNEQVSTLNHARPIYVKHDAWMGTLKSGNGIRNLKSSQEENPKYKSEAYRQEMDSHLGRCIARHQALLKYIQRLDILSSPIQFLQALTSSLLICTLGFTAISSGNPAILPKILMYTFDALLQIGLPCWYATQLRVQGERLAEAGYSCMWYDEPMYYQRSIGMIMMRAQRPLILTLGPFGTVSLELFAAVVQSAYSYLTLLRQVYE